MNKKSQSNKGETIFLKEKKTGASEFKKEVTRQLESMEKQKDNAEKSRKQFAIPISTLQGSPSQRTSPQFSKSLNLLQAFGVTVTPPAWQATMEKKFIASLLISHNAIVSAISQYVKGSL
jgi:hypothetical protein